MKRKEEGIKMECSSDSVLWPLEDLLLGVFSFFIFLFPPPGDNGKIPTVSWEGGHGSSSLPVAIPCLKPRRRAKEVFAEESQDVGRSFKLMLESVYWGFGTLGLKWRVS